MALLIASGLTGAAPPEAQRGGGDDGPQQLAALELEDANGLRLRPFASANAALHVLVFLANECPICNKYAPEIRRLYDAYQPRGAKFWLVHPLRDESAEAIRKHAREYALPGDILRDPQGRLTKLTGATVTPEAVVLDRGLRLVYRGRIDDRFAALGRERVRVSEFDLREALDAALAGKPVERARTQAVGCTIPDTN